MGIYIKGMTQKGMKLRRIMAGAVEKKITIAGLGCSLAVDQEVISVNVKVFESCRSGAMHLQDS